MAATVTIFRPRPFEWLITIVETATSNGETVEIQADGTEKLPKTGRMLRIRSQLISGSASEITPILAVASNFYANSIVVEAGLDTEIDEMVEGGIPYAMEGDILYHQSNPNTGSNNTIRTTYLLRDGWRE
jgi:hypothetical protein